MAYNSCFFMLIFNSVKTPFAGLGKIFPNISTGWGDNLATKVSTYTFDTLSFHISFFSKGDYEIYFAMCESNVRELLYETEGRKMTAEIQMRAS